MTAIIDPFMTQHAFQERQPREQLPDRASCGVVRTECTTTPPPSYTEFSRAVILPPSGRGTRIRTEELKVNFESGEAEETHDAVQVDSTCSAEKARPLRGHRSAKGSGKG
ncbi:hypothetical protein VTO42DRAFT_7016 [Malbranchea cinnamomea]